MTYLTGKVEVHTVAGEKDVNTHNYYDLQRRTVAKKDGFNRYFT